jgi:cation:H+ antiporter
MWLTIILFILGFIFLIKGANLMIDGSSSIARKYGISTFVIGLTIVAFGTSMPELIVSVLASIKGSADIALGNIIGSNISNTLLILGVSAIIYPLLVKKATVNKEIPFSLLAIAAVGILVNDFLIDKSSPDGLTRIDGFVLILFFSIFIYYTFGISKAKENIFEKIQGGLREEPKVYSNWLAILMIIVGLTSLAIGGRWLVDGAIVIARGFGMSEALIGLTIIAVGTSLPELAASAVAAYRRHADIAVGNIVGSNIFNFLWILGLSSIINPIGYSRILNIDMLILFGITLLLLFLIYIGRKNILGRWEGIILVSLYVLYIVFLVYRG